LLSFLKKVISYLTNNFHNENQSPDRIEKLNQFEELISYRFKNKSLLIAALTHDSFFRRSDTDTCSTSPYERMEFLGDSVLGLIVAEYLFAHFPDKAEGDLSKYKSNIVSEKFLAKKALLIKLGEFIQMSDEERKNGGEERKSIIADTMEALICALYLDGGLNKSRQFIHKFIISGFEKDLFTAEMINYKSILQEYTQSKYQCTPQYVLQQESGPDHQKTFIMEVYINSKKYGLGEGPNKKEAQQRAALAACKRLSLC